MRKISVLMSLIGALFAYHKADAQGFWYVPPGSDLSFRYGLDLGNGLGFGYGFGVGYGSFESPQAAIATAVADLEQLQNQTNATIYGTSTNYGTSTASEQNDCEWQHFNFAGSRHAFNLQPAQSKGNAATVRARQKVRRNTQSASGARLSDREFDRSTGRIFWPVVLLDESFSVQRGKVESLMNQVYQPVISRELGDGITTAAEQMRQMLREQVRTADARDYLAGHTFLSHLGHEGKLLLDSALQGMEIPW